MMGSDKISKYEREGDEERWQQKAKIRERKKQRKQRRNEKDLVF